MAEKATHVQLAPGVLLPSRALTFRFDRSGGPGGQNVNKLSTKATLTVTWENLATVMRPTALRRLNELAGHQCTQMGVQITCDESRSQLANRRTCLARLRELIVAAQYRPPPRRRTKPTRGSVERRINEKKQRGEIKRKRQPPPPPPG